MNLIADVSPVNFLLALYTFPNDPSPTKSSKLYSERLLLLLLACVPFLFIGGGVVVDGGGGGVRDDGD